MTDSGVKARAGRVGGKPCVVHVGPLPPPFGGMAAYVEQFLRSPVTRAFDVQNIHSDQIGKYRAVGARRKLLNVVNCTVLCVALLRSLLRYRPGIVHVQSSSFAGFFEKSVLTFLARSTGRKVLMHLQGGAFRTFYEQSPHTRRWLIRACLNIHDRVVANSRQMRQDLLDMGVPSRRITVLDNAVFVPPTGIWNGPGHVRSAHDRLDTTVTVLFLNRLAVAKGVPELIESARRLRSILPNVRFRIVGPDEPGERQFRDQVRMDGLEARVELPGPVAEEAKDAAFRAADIYVLPSHVEGMPIGLLEAMSYGLPCVVTPVGGVPSVVEDGVNGLLIPPRDSAALASAIQRLVTDPALRRRLGTAARETITSRFNWATRAGQIIDLYESLLRVPGP